MNAATAATALPTTAPSAAPDATSIAAGPVPNPSLLQRLRGDLRSAHRATTEDAARDLFDQWLDVEGDPFSGPAAITLEQARIRLVEFVRDRARTVRAPWLNVAGGILDEADMVLFATSVNGLSPDAVAAAAAAASAANAPAAAALSTTAQAAKDAASKQERPARGRRIANALASLSSPGPGVRVATAR